MDAITRLDTGGNVTLDASGNGAIVLRPSNAHQRWVVRSTVVGVSSNVKEPTCSTYVGGATTNNAIDTTYTGSRDSSDTQFDVPYGAFMTVQWLAGDAGAIASVSVTGDLIQNRG